MTNGLVIGVAGLKPVPPGCDMRSMVSIPIVARSFSKSDYKTVCVS
jgi:hypothetical protein